MSNAEPAPISSSSGPAFAPGDKLAGVYILREEVRGEAGSPIWLAQDEVLGKDVSLHFLPAVVRGDARAMGELRQEIKRNRQLIHPGILRVYDLVEEPEWSAISMDWLEGQSLAALLAAKGGGFFEPSEIKPWLQQACHTLDDVHKIQIVHRDVAPHNIFVDARGKVLLAKFGISRVIEDAAARLDKTRAQGDTRLASLSPQGLDGETPNKLDDIYSLGATVYELLTGQLPFEGPDLLPQIRKNMPPPMMERRAKLGKRGGTILPVWEKWIAAALAKDPTARPQTAADFAQKLGLSGKLSSEAMSATAPAPAVVPTVPMVEKVAPTVVEPPKTLEPAPVGAETPAEKAEEVRPTLAPDVEKEQKTPTAKAAELAGVAASVAVAEPAIARAAASSHKEKSEPITLSAPVPIVSTAPVVSAAAIGLPSQASPEPHATIPAPVTPPHSATPESASLTDAMHEEDVPPAVARAESQRPEPANRYPYDRDEVAPSRKGPVIFGVLAAAVALIVYFVSRPSDSGKDHSAQTASTPTPATATPSSNVADTHRAPSGNSETLSGEPLLEDKHSASATPRASVAVSSGESSSRATPPPLTASTPPPPINSGVAAPLASGLPSAGAAAVGDPNDPLEKTYQNALKQKQLADTALAEADKAVQQKAKASDAIVKAAEPLLAQRTQKAEQLKAAQDAAQAARQAADERARAAEEAKKAVSDWETAHASQLVARDKATAELAALQTAFTEKQQQAADAAKALAAADAGRQQKLAALQQAQAAAEKERQETARRAAEERARKSDEIDKQIQAMQARLLELQKMREQPDAAPSSSSPAPATPTPVATPVKAGATPKVVSTPKTAATPVALATPSAPPASPAALQTVNATPTHIPPPPPGPQPNRNGGLQNEFLPPMPAAGTQGASTTSATPTPLAMLSATPTIVRPAVATPPPASTSDEAAPAGGENSLGMRFAPVGEVAFCIWPTRVKDFEVFARETGFHNSSWRSPGFKQAPDHPVVNVSWNDAMAFCKWLTERDRKRNIINKDQSYRLPTDLEWSRAVGLPEESGKTPEARDMGVPDVFPWGNQWPPPPNVGNYTGEETGSDVAIKGYEDGYAWTSPVGSFPPNKYGLYDVGGNVWQWCMDNWNPESRAKVLRGASWYNGALKLSLLSSCRVHAYPDASSDNYGFRVVRTGDNPRSRSR